MKSIFSALSELEATHQPAALCTVIKTSGSTPRHSTSKMLVYSNGEILGTVGGGELENRVRKEALDSLQDGQPRLLSYNMTDPSRGDVGVCGGQVVKAVAHLAKWLGYHVVVSYDRPEFCTHEAIPDADEFYNVQMTELPL